MLTRNRFHANLLTRYENWVANGEELLTKEDLDTMLILMDTSGENNKLPTHPSIMNH